MKNQPFISAILPIYNPNREWLEKAINSVLQQTYDNLELVIVNDGSEKKLDHYIDEEILSQDRVRTFSQENQGFTGATNTAMQKARGDYVAPISQDDEWELEKIEKQIKEMDKEDEICLSRARKVVDENGSSHLSPRFPDKDEFIESLIKSNFIRYEGSLISKKILREYNYLDEDFEICSDWDFWLRSLPHENFNLVDEPLYKKRFHENSASGNSSTFYREIEKIKNKYGSLYLEEMKLNRVLSEDMKYIGQEAFESAQPKKARKIWMNSIKYKFNLRSLALLGLSYTPYYSILTRKWVNWKNKL